MAGLNNNNFSRNLNILQQVADSYISTSPFIVNETKTNLKNLIKYDPKKPFNYPDKKTE
ncbi:UNVERIFIED_CONTAM: hypothetical protein O8I53_13710 [Campylobacter lari]